MPLIFDGFCNKESFKKIHWFWGQWLYQYMMDTMKYMTKKVKIKHNAYILNRTTAVSSTGQQTTCLPIFALWGTIRAHDRWSLPLTSWPNGQWHFLKPVQDETVPSCTLPRWDITLGVFWTTVFHVTAANSLIKTKIKRVFGKINISLRHVNDNIFVLLELICIYQLETFFL